MLHRHSRVVGSERLASALMNLESFPRNGCVLLAVVYGTRRLLERLSEPPSLEVVTFWTYSRVAEAHGLKEPNSSSLEAFESAGLTANFRGDRSGRSTGSGVCQLGHSSEVFWDCQLAHVGIRGLITKLRQGSLESNCLDCGQVFEACVLFRSQGATTALDTDL